VKTLHSLVYVSSAVRTVSEADIRHLLARAQHRNRQCGVTGVLLFDAGNFMQYLEGPEDGLAEVYQHIRRDGLHTGLIEVCTEQPPARLFANWAMGFRSFNAAAFTDDWLRQQVQETRLDRLHPPDAPATSLLRGFWQRSQRRLPLGAP
jgi:hypothetical protein